MSSFLFPLLFSKMPGLVFLLSGVLGSSVLQDRMKAASNIIGIIKSKKANMVKSVEVLCDAYIILANMDANPWKSHRSKSLGNGGHLGGRVWKITMLSSSLRSVGKKMVLPFPHQSILFVVLTDNILYIISKKVLFFQLSMSKWYRYKF